MVLEYVELRGKSPVGHRTVTQYGRQWKFLRMHHLRYILLEPSGEVYPKVWAFLRENDPDVEITRGGIWKRRPCVKVVRAKKPVVCKIGAKIRLTGQTVRGKLFIKNNDSLWKVIRMQGNTYATIQSLSKPYRLPNGEQVDGLRAIKVKPCIDFMIEIIP